MSAEILGPTPFGPYALEALIGQGGMAEVFRARELDGGRIVAVKRLLPELAGDSQYVSLFTAEAALSRQLRHPNIVEVLEAGTIDGEHFIAMEYVDGRDLAQILRRCRARNIRLPVDFAVYLGVTLLEALDYAHHAQGTNGQPLNVVHCDVSPSNLFISRTGEIKLGDFGISRVRTAGADGAGIIRGKPYYLSPETLDGTVDTATDLWAAAVTLYELLANHRPFTGTNPAEVAADIRAAAPPSLAGIRVDLAAALAARVHRGLDVDPTRRYASAAAFAEALRPHFNELIGTPLAIAAVVRGLFGA